MHKHGMHTVSYIQGYTARESVPLLYRPVSI